MADINLLPERRDELLQEIRKARDKIRIGDNNESIEMMHKYRKVLLRSEAELSEIDKDLRMNNVKI